MKFLVGLIYYCENEYKDCKKSIREQTYQKWDLFEVKKLPKKEAHHKLYSTFMQKASEYELFLKLDADMVLARPTIFEEIISEVRINNDINHFEIKLLDNFTNSLIFGLHVYRNNVRWNLGDEVYFTDRINYDTSYKSYTTESDPCVPVAIHSPNPSTLQSFHFGIHKMVKVTQKGNSKPDLNSSIVHLRNIYLTHKNYLRTSNIILSYAILGAFWALKENAGYDEANYENEKTKLALNNYKKISTNEIENKVSTINSEYYLDLPIRLWTIYMIFRVHYLRNSLSWFLTKIQSKLKDLLLR